jgi:release factor glutamine methyltransferase
MTIREALRTARADLGSVSTTPELDADILMAFCIGRADVFVLTHPEYELTMEEAARFTNAIARRATGVPVAYITQKKEFYSRDFFVDDRVLVPRPETEMLVDAVKKYALSAELTAPDILDIGTGSGCIAISLAAELPEAIITATDISMDALGVAQKNAELLKTEVAFYAGDLFAALPQDMKGMFDCIVSNPPYVNMDNIDTKSPGSSALPHEPQNALTPPNGQPSEKIIARILQDAGTWLSPHGALFIEIGHDQGTLATKLAQTHFPTAVISIEKDLAGFDRMLSVI